MATSKVTNLSILDDAVRTAGIQDAAVTPAKTSGVPTLFLPTAKPIIINGDMAVAQRNSGTVAQSDGSNEGYATVDRMQTTFGNSAGGTITTSRDNEAPTGFGQSMKFDITGADASVGATHIVYSEHTIEAQVIRNSGWNYTSSSSYLTLSFQIRSSKTGTYCVFFQTNDGTAYMYTAEYTISSADTWEKKVITLPGNSNLTFNNDNGKGLIVAWVWAVGTDRDGTADAWTTGNAYGTSNQVNFLDSTSNIAYITGVQLEVGEYTSSDLPPFRHESYGDNLARCQRYFQKLTNGESGKGLCMVRYWSSTAAGGVFNLPTTMRANPSASYANGTGYWLISGGTGGTNDPFDTITNNDTSLQNAGWYSGSAATGTAGYAGLMMTNSTSAKAEFSAEL